MKCETRLIEINGEHVKINESDYDPTIHRAVGEVPKTEAATNQRGGKGKQ